MQRVPQPGTERENLSQPAQPAPVPSMSATTTARRSFSNIPRPPTRKWGNT